MTSAQALFVVYFLSSQLPSVRIGISASIHNYYRYNDLQGA
jgi:hypothetical protein